MIMQTKRTIYLSVALLFTVIAALVITTRTLSPGNEAPKEVHVEKSTELAKVNNSSSENYEDLQDNLVKINQFYQDLQANQDQIAQRQSRLQEDIETLKEGADGSSETTAIEGADKSITQYESEQAELSAVEIAQAKIETFESSYNFEDIDTTWSHDAEEQISTVLNIEKLQGTQILNSECHSTICKLEVTLKDEVAMDDFVDEITLSLGWENSSHIQILEKSDAGVNMVVYLSRDGEVLPEVFENN
ncbi:MAG: hypothetical protein ACC707_10090 [Thiohalomonadales bacterium]